MSDRCYKPRLPFMPMTEQMLALARSLWAEGHDTHEISELVTRKLGIYVPEVTVYNHIHYIKASADEFGMAMHMRNDPGLVGMTAAVPEPNDLTVGLAHKVEGSPKG